MTISLGVGRLFAVLGPPLPKHSSKSVKWGTLILGGQNYQIADLFTALHAKIRKPLADYRLGCFKQKS